MGWITPLGDDIEQVWQRLLKATAASRHATVRCFDIPDTFSAQVKSFDLTRYLGADADRHRKRQPTTPSSPWPPPRSPAAAAGGLLGLDPTRTGIYLGGGEGPIDFFNFAEAAVKAWNREANNGRGDLDARKWAEIAGERLDAVREFEQDPNMAAGHIACQFNAQGPTFNTLTACAASTQAIGESTNLIRRGDADVVISGGTHSMIHPFGVTGFNRLTALSTRNDTLRHTREPAIDRTRDGFVLGEGRACSSWKSTSTP